MNSKKIFFQNRNNISLAAYLDTPDNAQPQQFALLAHCFTCSKHIKAYHYISQVMTAHGFGVMRLDFTGIGESKGDFNNTNLHNNIEDLIDASQWLEQHHTAPAMLIGHSLGGIAALTATETLADCKAVVVIGTPDETHHLYRLLSSEITRVEATNTRAITLGGKHFEITPSLLDSLRNHQMRTHIENLHCPLLILHAPDDDTVSLTSAENIFSLAPHPKGFIALDQADHLLTKEKDARYAGELIATWLQRHG